MAKVVKKKVAKNKVVKSVSPRKKKVAKSVKSVKKKVSVKKKAVKISKIVKDSKVSKKVTATRSADKNVSGKKKSEKFGKSKADLLNDEPSDMTNVTVYKFLGYCPSCYGMIGTVDLVSKQVFLCNCKKRGRISLLNSDRFISEDRPTSKKEYLQNTLHEFDNSFAPVSSGPKVHSELGSNFSDVADNTDDD